MGREGALCSLWSSVQQVSLLGCQPCSGSDNPTSIFGILSILLSFFSLFLLFPWHLLLPHITYRPWEMCVPPAMAVLGRDVSRDDYLALLHCSAVMMAIYQAIPWWTGLDLDTRVSVLPNSSPHVVPTPAFLEGRRIWQELPDTLPSMQNSLQLGGEKKDNNKKKQKTQKKPTFCP